MGARAGGGHGGADPGGAEQVDLDGLGSGASKETVAAEWMTMSLAARAARPASSSPRPSWPTSPGTAWTRRATSAAKSSPSSVPEAVEAVVPDDLTGQSGGGIRPPAGPNQYGDLGVRDAAQDAFDQRSAQKSGRTGNEEALCTEVPADRHRNCLPSAAESVYHLVSEHRRPSGERAAVIGPSRPERRASSNAALASFATRGYDGHLARCPGQGARAHKQSILYWFPSKDAVLEAVIARSAADLSDALETALRAPASGGCGSKPWSARSSGWRRASPNCSDCCARYRGSGPPAATQMTVALEPLVRRASAFLEAEMDAGTMRRHDPRLLLLAIYSTVIGMVTEVEVLRALGEEPTARSLVRRRTDVLALLRSALVIPPAEATGPA